MVTMASIPFPSTVAEIGRYNIDQLVKYMGTTCYLYKIESRVAKDGLESTFITTFPDVPITTKVVIDWNPEIRLLKALGLYMDDGEGDSKPILAYFKFEDDPKQNDYITLDIEYEVGEIHTNKFEVIDRKFHGYGIQQRAVWVLAPLRRGQARTGS